MSRRHGVFCTSSPGAWPRSSLAARWDVMRNASVSDLAIANAGECGSGSSWRRLGLFQGWASARIVHAARRAWAQAWLSDVQLGRTDGLSGRQPTVGSAVIRQGRVATLNSKNGLPCDSVHWAIEDDDHSVWLYMACGLVRIAQTELDAWAARSEPQGSDARFWAVPTELESMRTPRGLQPPQFAKSTDGSCGLRRSRA